MTDYNCSTKNDDTYIKYCESAIRRIDERVFYTHYLNGSLEGNELENGGEIYFTDKNDMAYHIIIRNEKLKIKLIDIDSGIEISKMDLVKLKYLLNNKDTLKKVCEDFEFHDFLDFLNAEEQECLPANIFKALPNLLQRICSKYKILAERDIMLLSSIAVISGCLPNVFGRYDRKIVYPNIYLFISAPPASGKGCMVMSKYLGKLIHKQFIDEYDYSYAQYIDAIKAQENDKKTGSPEKPKRELLFIPGDISSAAFFQQLNINRFGGILFESEADSLGGALKREWGNFSDLLRKAFHHETFSFSRKTDDLYVEIDEPKLTIILSGTANQVFSVIKSVKDGSFSRYIYYCYSPPLKMKDVFSDEDNLEDFYKELGAEVLNINQRLQSRKAPLKISYTKEQEVRFHRIFSNEHDRLLQVYGAEILANIRRIGLICFRISMILTVLNNIDKIGTADAMCCSDEDFTLSVQLVKALIPHTIRVYNDLGNNTAKIKSQKKNRVYEALPHSFKRTEGLAIAENLDMKRSTYDNFIADDVLFENPEHGFYIKKIV